MRSRTAPVMPSAHALVVKLNPSTNPVHILTEMLMPLSHFAFHCTRIFSTVEHRKLWVVMEIDERIFNSIRTRWFDSVIPVLLEFISNRNCDNVLLNWRPNSRNDSVEKYQYPVTYLNKSQHSTDGLCFEQHSWIHSRNNGPFSPLKIPESVVAFHNLSCFLWHFHIESEFIQDSKSNFIWPESLLERVVPNKWALQQSAAYLISAFNRTEFHSLAISTRYNEQPLNSTPTIELLSPIVKKRLESESRKLRILVYDRKHESDASNVRIWNNSEGFVRLLNEVFPTDSIEIHLVHQLPKSVRRQSELFTADVIVAPHGGHFGNLMFSVNAVVIEFHAVSKWYHWMNTESTFGHVFVNLQANEIIESSKHGIVFHVEPKLVLDVLNPLFVQLNCERIA